MSLTGQELIVGAVIAAAMAYLAWRVALTIKRRGGCGSCGSQKPLVQLDLPPAERESP
jgi:hypothetical protein